MDITESKFQRIFKKICCSIIIFIAATILLVLTMTSMLYTNKIYGSTEIVRFESDSILKHTSIILLLMALGLYLKRRNIKIQIRPRLIIVVCLFLTGAYAAWILSTQLNPISDQKLCLYASVDLLNGDYHSWNVGGYAFRYPNQNGLILFYALIGKLFGKGNALFIQFINLAAAVAAVIYLAKFSEKLLFIPNKFYLILALLLYAPLLFYITFVYGTLPGFACAVMGLYYQYRFLLENRLIAILPCIIFSCGAVLFKSNYLIFIVAMVIIFLFHAIYKKNLQGLIGCVLLIALYLFSNQFVKASLEHITGCEIKAGTPTVSWITMGLQESEMAPGWYSDYNYTLFSRCDFNAEKAASIAERDLQAAVDKFIHHPGYAVKFFGKKISSMWNEPTFQSIWIQDVKSSQIERTKIVDSLLDKEGKLHWLYLHVFDSVQTLVYLFALLFIAKNRKNMTVYQLCPVIIFIGGFLFHLFWEGKAQYTVIYFFLLIPYAFKGFQQTLELFSRFIDRRKPPVALQQAESGNFNL